LAAVLGLAGTLALAGVATAQALGKAPSASAAPVANQEESFLVRGEVEALTVERFGRPSCQRVPARTNPDGSTTIVISNACGCVRLEVKVSQTYLGRSGRQVFNFEEPLGEWCKPNISLNQSILVQGASGRVRWSRLIRKKGELHYDPDELGPVTGHRSETDADGLAPLAPLLKSVNVTAPEAP
jgi:hypothetical protein